MKSLVIDGRKRISPPVKPTHKPGNCLYIRMPREIISFTIKKLGLTIINPIPRI
jgi:hypothetical protein